MKKWKRGCLAVLAAAFFILSLGGCGIKDGIMTQVHSVFGLGKNQMFRIGNQVCQKAEAEIFLSSQKAAYESAYGASIWQVDIENGKNFEHYMLDSLKEFLARLKCMQIMASNEGVSLTKEEISLAQTAGREYYSKLGKENAKKMGVSEKLAIKVFEEYHLANKLADKLTEGESGVISDSEARVIHIQQIFIRSGNEQKAQEALEKAQAGSDFESLAKKYGEGNQISFTVGRGELPQPVEEAAFALNDNQISGMVETEDGYYIVKCIEDYDASATQANKTKIYNQRKVDVFLRKYQEFSKNCSSELNEKAWNSLSYKAVEDVPVNFYEIYMNYFNKG